MTTIADIQKAILSLPETDYIHLRQWFSELDWKKWDQQIEADSQDGKLDFLVAQALEAKSKGALMDL